MPKYKVTLPNGHTYRINSERELTDAEAHQAAVTQAATEPKEPTKVDPKETDNYWSGAWNGFKQGAAGGLKGFEQGIRDAPGNLLGGITKGIESSLDGSMLTQAPGTAGKEIWDGIKKVPGIVTNAGNDPETYGNLVGNATAQTGMAMIGPKAVKPALKVTRDVVSAAENHPIAVLAGAQRAISGHPVQGALAVAAPYMVQKVKQGLGALIKEDPAPMEGLKLPTRKAPTVNGSLEDALGEMMMEELKNSKAPGTAPQTMTPAGKPSITPAGYDELLANSPGPTPPAAPVDPIVEELLRRFPHLKDSSRYKVE